MRRFTQLSLLSAVGGSLFALDSAFEESRDVLAQTSDGLDQGERRNSSSLLAVISLLLDQQPAQPDQYVTEQNTRLLVSAEQGVISNDEASSGSMVALLRDVANGELILNPDGSFDYLPDIGFVGVDTFRYILTLANGASSEALVSIRVNGVPDAIDDDYNLDLSLPFTGNVIANEVGGTDSVVDNAQVVSVTEAETALGGRVSIDANGDFAYAPPADLGVEQDSFVYTLQDAQGEQDTAAITWQFVPLVLAPSPLPSVDEGDALEFTVPLFIPGQLASLTVNSEVFELTALASASSENPLNVSVFDFGQISIIGLNEAGVVIRYLVDTPLFHSGEFADALSESIQIELIDNSRTIAATGTIEIRVLDTVPLARNDTRSLSEETSAIAGNAVGAAGSQLGDTADTILDTNTTPVIDIDFGEIDGIPGTAIESSFGTFIINTAGIYTYTLDNTNPAVQALSTGESLTEAFTYTIEDADGDTASADVTISIDGVDDPSPVIEIPNTNGSAFGDVSVAENAVLNNAQFTFQLLSALIENGFSITDGSGTVLSNNPDDIRVNQIFTLTNGVMTITGVNQVQGLVQYQYDPFGANRNHSDGDFSVFDEISFSATNVENESSSDTLTIVITDTAPTAAMDNADIDENQAVVTGDVITNDTQGADTAVSVSLVGFNAQNQTVGIPFNTEFGTVDLNADGTYTYTLDNANASVDALIDLERLVEEINYTIVDTDGDTSSTSLSINILGVSD